MTVSDRDRTGPAGRERYRALPEPPPREAWVETVDTAEHPLDTEDEERARMLRLAGAP